MEMSEIQLEYSYNLRLVRPAVNQNVDVNEKLD